MKLLKPQCRNFDEKVKYLLDCVDYICDQYGFKSEITEQQADTFLRKLALKVNINSVGTNYIFNYLTYIFYTKLKIRRFEAFKSNWLISNQALQDWINKPDDWYVYHGAWLFEAKLVKPMAEVNINPRNTEETFRRKYHNMVKGFVTCIENTSLYDPESRFCRTCFKKLECRKILQNNNPELYDARIK